MKKHLVFFLMLLILSSMTTSCWSRREIEDLGFVMGIGVSKTHDGLYSMVVQFANPGAIVAENPDQRDIYTIMKADGLSIFDALRNLSMVAGRRLFLSHIQVMIIDENIAKEGISEFLGFLLQDMEVRLEQEVFVSKIPPEEIFETPNTLGIIPAMALHAIALNQGVNSKIYVADLHEALEAIHNPVMNFVTGVVEIMPAPTSLEMDFLNITKIAVFDHDKLVGYLHHEDGQAYNFITDNFTNAPIVFDNNSANEKITIEVLESRTNITPSYSNGKVGFHIDVTTKGNLAERTPRNEMADELIIEELNKQFSKVLQDKISKGILTAQREFEVDYFNLSGHFSRKYPREYSKLKTDWNKHFSNADITVSINTSIIHEALGTLGGSR